MKNVNVITVKTVFFYISELRLGDIKTGVTKLK